MAFEPFDFDPFTGVKTSIAWDQDKFHVRYEQDVTPILDHAKAINNAGLSDEAWKRNGAALYAMIPPVVQGELLKKGINFLDPNQIRDVLREINSNYTYCKATDRTHNV